MRMVINKWELDLDQGGFGKEGVFEVDINS